MEVDAADGAVVLFEAVDQGTDAVVPELDGAIVERDADPGTDRVEGKALYAGGLGAELLYHGGGGGGSWGELLGTERVERREEGRVRARFGRTNGAAIDRMELVV